MGRGGVENSKNLRPVFQKSFAPVCRILIKSGKDFDIEVAEGCLLNFFGNAQIGQFAGLVDLIDDSALKDIAALVQAFFSRISKRRQLPLSPQTLYTTLGALGAVLEFLKRDAKLFAQLCTFKARDGLPFLSVLSDIILKKSDLIQGLDAVSFDRCVQAAKLLRSQMAKRFVTFKAKMSEDDASWIEMKLPTGDRPPMDDMLAAFMERMGGPADPAPPPADPKTVCGNPKCVNLPKGAKCSRCKVVYYCGRSCQEIHWPLHKKNCRKKEKECASGCCAGKP
jgi:hypothetical protein